MQAGAEVQGEKHQGREHKTKKQETRNTIETRCAHRSAKLQQIFCPSNQLALRYEDWEFWSTIRFGSSQRKVNECLGEISLECWASAVVKIVGTKINKHHVGNPL